MKKQNIIKLSVVPRLQIQKLMRTSLQIKLQVGEPSGKNDARFRGGKEVV